MSKLCIYGSRGCTPTPEEIDAAYRRVIFDSPAGSRFPIPEGITCVISGGARGADLAGEAWAARRGIEVRQYLADWDRYGKTAGFRRNHEMAKECDAALGFWDGTSSGTKDMTTRLVLLGKPVHVVLWRKR